ncbi:hypothetical protein C2E21_6772 [Chlorella sorokiniana]|uniref:Uncharacterized protein n=1 Tax=Chlorella sorokiniana TaxID=3076 RepID=A0A2P6TKK8_CHLSO|nr:hypothetical protein C2E21_6772 [Chlorella sorokiniana]|eukprot:PRW44619.1 hypothetical protein C2E21_6772 [Chlorella sorokiniana]
MLGSGSNLPTARAAAAARDACVLQLYQRSMVSRAVVSRSLNLGEGALPRSLVRRVCHDAGHGPVGLPWLVRWPHLPGSTARFSTQPEAERAALASYLLADGLRRAVLALEGQPPPDDDAEEDQEGQRQQRQQPLGPAERAELLVGFAIARSAGGRSAQPPPPPASGDAAALEAWAPEACLAEEGLAGSEERQRRLCRTPEGRLTLGIASHSRRHEALAATRPGVLRQPHMPTDHYLMGLSRPLAAVVLHRCSPLQLLDRRGHLDHRRPLSWSTAQCTEVLWLDNLDLICWEDNLEKGSLGVRLRQTADGSGIHFEHVTRRGEPTIPIEPGSAEYQAIMQHLAACAEEAARRRQLIEEVGGPDRRCPCVCAYERGEALSPRQVEHLDHFLADDVYRFVVEFAAGTVEEEMIPASAVLSTGVLGDPQRFLPASLPQRRDGMLVPGAQRSTHTADSDEEGGSGSDSEGDEAAQAQAQAPPRRRLNANLEELLAGGVDAWAAQLPASIPQGVRTLMRESALLELRRRFRLAEAVVRQEEEQRQAAQQAAQRQAAERQRLRQQWELRAAEQARQRQQQRERAAAAAAEVERLAAEAAASSQRQAAQRAARAISSQMFAIKQGYGEGSPQHERAYRLRLQLLQRAGVPMQPIYGERQAMECALLRRHLEEQESGSKRRRQ